MNKLALPSENIAQRESNRKSNSIVDIFASGSVALVGGGLAKFAGDLYRSALKEIPNPEVFIEQFYVHAPHVVSLGAIGLTYAATAGFIISSYTFLKE